LEGKDTELAADKKIGSAFGAGPGGRLSVQRRRKRKRRFVAVGWHVELLHLQPLSTFQLMYP